jgi:hypothetical protein
MGGDSEWTALAEEVNKYTSMATQTNDSSSDSDDKGPDDNKNEGHHSGGDLIDTDIDRERDETDTFTVNQCEELAELDESNLVLEPITVAQRREVCVLLSKVRNMIFCQGPQLTNL